MKKELNITIEIKDGESIDNIVEELEKMRQQMKTIGAVLKVFNHTSGTTRLYFVCSNED